MNETNFSWRNVLKATPANVFWIFQTLEAIVLAIQTYGIIEETTPKYFILIFLALQVVISKAVLFFGKIKDEYEHQKVVTITSDDPNAEVTVTEEIKKVDG